MISIDEVVDVDLEETRGRVVRVRRRLKLSGLSSVDQVSAMQEVLDSLPAPGSTISVNGWTLYLTGRNPSLRESSDLADATLTYEGGAGGGALGSGEVRRGGRGGLSQITPFMDRDGAILQVVHDGAKQGGRLSVFVPTANPYFETIENTSSPETLQAAWLGYVNSSTWRGKAAGQWIVSQADYDEANAAANLWRFQWSITESTESQGWLPIITWIDPTTNLPLAKDLQVDGVSNKIIPWYPQRDFNSKFS